MQHLFCSGRLVKGQARLWPSSRNLCFVSVLLLVVICCASLACTKVKEDKSLRDEFKAAYDTMLQMAGDSEYMYTAMHTIAS